jgi:hypothetical protein
MQATRGRGVRRAVKKLLLTQPHLSNEAIVAQLDADDAVGGKGDGTKSSIPSIASIRNDFRSTMRALEGLGRLADWAAETIPSPPGDKQLVWFDRFNQILFSERDISGADITKRLKAEGFTDFESQVSNSRSASRESIEILEEFDAILPLGLATISDPRGFHLPDELPDGENFYEGARQQVLVNRYERDPKAREACIRHYGGKYTCAVCCFSFEQVYGQIGRNYIHVHHIVPLSRINARYEMDPVKDLIPVCPNCHAMLHRGALSVEELKARVGSGR